MTGPMMHYSIMARRMRGADWSPPVRLLSLDPGETTGWSYFEGFKLVDCGQLAMGDYYQRVGVLINLFRSKNPTAVVAEDYFIYGYKTEQHAWSHLYTAKLIGVIESLCYIKKVSYCLQAAGQAKGFCTDDKLKAWKVFQTSKRHANDSIRHAIHYFVLGGSNNAKVWRPGP